MSLNPRNNQNPNKTTITTIIINHHIQQIQFNNPIHIQTKIQIQIQTQLLKQQQQLQQEIHRHSHQLHLHHHYLLIFNVIRLMLLMGMERVNIVVGELGMGCMVVGLADMDRVMMLINSRNNNTATNTQKTNHHQISQILTLTQAHIQTSQI